jgi:hypothetical protein
MCMHHISGVSKHICIALFTFEFKILNIWPFLNFMRFVLGCNVAMAHWNQISTCWQFVLQNKDSSRQASCILAMNGIGYFQVSLSLSLPTSAPSPLTDSSCHGFLFSISWIHLFSHVLLCFRSLASIYGKSRSLDVMCKSVLKSKVMPAPYTISWRRHMIVVCNYQRGRHRYTFPP